MPRELFIDERIEMRGTGNRTHNMDGNWMEKRRHRFDCFDRIALDTTNQWASDTADSTAGSIAISEVQGGSCLMTSGTGDEDTIHLASPIIYSADYEATVEWKIKISDVSGCAVFAGFSDAKSEDGYNPLDYGTGGADTFTSTADDAVGFVIDADHASSSIMCASCKATVDTTPVDTGLDWADNQTKRLRVSLNADGDATFYVDGESVGYIDSAITEDDLLCAIVSVKTQANDGANTVYVYRNDTWQNEV